MSKTTNTIARIENNLIFNSKYQLTAKEQKVILFLISRIDPVRQKDFESRTVSLKSLEKVLMDGNKNGSFYSEIRKLTSRIIKKGISFLTDVEVSGEYLSGHINWFQSIIPMRNDKGEAAIKFKFSEDLKPFLLQLKEYAQIDYIEVLPLNSGFSIRLFQIFRAHRNRMAKHQNKSKIKYELNELKNLLGIEGKYASYSNFRKRVLIPVEKEINEHTSIRMKYIPKKTGYSVTDIEFEFWDKGKRAQKPNKKGALDFDALTFAQLKAFDRLVAYGVNDGIALEMLSKVKSSEIKGFEDWYFSEVIDIFELKTNQQVEGAKAGTLVIWFLKKKVFEQGDHFAKIMENLQAKKKQLQTKNSDKWDNRMLAKDITAKKFRKQFSK